MKCNSNPVIPLPSGTPYFLPDSLALNPRPSKIWPQATSPKLPLGPPANSL